MNRIVKAISSSFIHKVTLFIVLFFLIILSGLYFFTSTTLHRTLQQEYENYADNIEIFIQNNLLPLLITNDLDGISYLLSSLKNLDIIGTIRVYSYDQLVYELDNQHFDTEMEQAPQARVLRVDFVVSDEPIGYVEVTLLLKERLARLHTSQIGLLLVSIGAALLFTIVLVFFLTSVKRKLHYFEQASIAVSHHRIPDFLPAKGHDEFSRTANAFNEMLWQLREKYVALDMSPDGILIVSGDGRITYVNPALSRMLDMGIEHYVGKQLSDIDTLIRQQLNRDASDVSSLTYGFHEAQLVFERTNSSQLILRCHKERYGATAEHGYSTVFYFVDITHETEVERLKSEFLNTAAHELRTPLASILGFSELLLNFEYSQEQYKKVLSTIHNQSSLLTSIIDDLLDIAKIESINARYVELKSGNLADLLEECCQQARIMAQIKKIHIVDSFPEHILATFDPAKLKRAILNLFSNAIKYSSEGTTIQVDYIAPQLKQPWQMISIADQGIGMSEEQLGHLGEKFYRADDSGKIQGTGLGVSISKQIAILHGGDIIYKSQLGKGTTAIIKLPVFNMAHTTVLTEPACPPLKH